MPQVTRYAACLLKYSISTVSGFMQLAAEKKSLNTETKKLLHNEVHKLLLIVTRMFICKSQCCISIHFSVKFIALHFIKIGHYICLKDTVVQALCTLFHFL